MGMLWSMSLHIIPSLRPQSSSQTALAPMAANTGTYMHLGGAVEAERRLQSPVMGHCSARKRQG